METAGDQIVSGAFGSALGQDRSLDFKEIFSVEESPHHMDDFMSEDKVVLQGRSSHIEISIFESEVLIDIGFLVDVERRSLGRIQDYELVDEEFDLAGRKLFVDCAFRSGGYDTLGLDTKFTPQSAGQFMSFFIGLRIEYDL
jgi:hypothetical protein